jgi:hypothetical protein
MESFCLPRVPYLLADPPLLRFPTPTECTSSFEYTRYYEAIVSEKACKKGILSGERVPLVHNTWSSGCCFHSMCIQRCMGKPPARCRHAIEPFGALSSAQHPQAGPSKCNHSQGKYTVECNFLPAVGHPLRSLSSLLLKIVS